MGPTTDQLRILADLPAADRAAILALFRDRGPAGVGPSLTQSRTTLSSPVYAAGSTSDDSPLSVEIPRAPQAGEHWVLDNAGMVGKLATRIPPSGQLLSPVSGLFLVEQGRSAVENLTTASAGDGWDARARGIVLPVTASIVPLINGGWAYAIFYNGMIGRTIPEGWVLRGIVNVNPGDAAPGPGSGSTGELFGVVSREMNYGANPL